ncbi:hypothetical protein B0H17DRAFT_977813 [Mycena rosella]|uniref:Uncharacterized protein n=1 Tax=Mycena rosella TaxID=1033263 RepID=A0AAD7DVN5_MYCRO|nr:hypothetical protein B0H17DRAFT_977813 [Mycena rosella]
MSTTEAVLQHVPYHAQLLASIAELEYAPKALIQQDSYIAGLEQWTARGTKKIKALEAKTKKEHQGYQIRLGATSERFAAKLTGRKAKFEASVSKAEMDWNEALAKEMQEKSQQAMLETMITEAKAVRVGLKSKAEIYKLTITDLAELYKRVFDGPSLAYPEDDRLEYQLQLAQRQHTDVQALFGRESQAQSFLQAANSALLLCGSKIKEALSYSRWDMFGSGDKAKMMKRNALSAAEGLAMQTVMNVQQAILLSPEVQFVGDIQIAHGSIWSDVIFHNVISEMAFHDKIKTSAQNVADVQLKVRISRRTFRIPSDKALSRGAADGAARGGESPDSRLGHGFERGSRRGDTRAPLEAFRRGAFESASAGIIPPEVLPTNIPPPELPPAYIEFGTCTVPQLGVIFSVPIGITTDCLLGSPLASSVAWGSRNPFAAALAVGS